MFASSVDTARMKTTQWRKSTTSQSHALRRVFIRPFSVAGLDVRYAGYFTTTPCLRSFSLYCWTIYAQALYGYMGKALFSLPSSTVLSLISLYCGRLVGLARYSTRSSLLYSKLAIIDHHRPAWVAFQEPTKIPNLKSLYLI